MIVDSENDLRYAPFLQSQLGPSPRCPSLTEIVCNHKKVQCGWTAHNCICPVSVTNIRKDPERVHHYPLFAVFRTRPHIEPMSLQQNKHIRNALLSFQFSDGIINNYIENLIEFLNFNSTFVAEGTWVLIFY